MAANDMNVTLALDIKQFQRGIRESQRQMQRFANNMRSVGQSLLQNITLPIVAIGGNALRTAAQFESAMNQVAAVSGATGKDFQNLENLAKELGETTSFSASQAAEGMSFLAMAGLEVNDILESMPGVLNLAAAGQMDLAQASDIASNILTGFGKDASQMNQAVDVLAKTFTSSNTNLVQLGEAMAYVAPVAASAGLQFEEVSAAVGLLGNAGIQASMAGTTLRGAITRLLNPTAEVEKVLSDLGISALDSSDNLLPLNQIIRLLEESGASTGQVMELFGKTAGPGMAALLSQGSSSLRELTSELENSGGTAQKIADKQLEGLNGSLKRLQSAFEGLMISIAEGGLLDAATRLVERLTVAVGKLADRFKNLSPQMQENILLIAGIAAAAGPLLMIFGNIVSAGSTLYGVFGKLKIGFMGGAAGLSRFIPVIGTAIALFAAMYKNSEKLRSSIGPLFGAIGNIFKALFKLVDAAFSLIPGIDGLNHYFKLLGDTLGVTLEGITNLINGILELDFKKIGAGLLDIIGVGNIRRAFIDGKSFGEAYSEGVKEGIKNKFTQTEIDKLYEPFQQQVIPGVTPVKVEGANQKTDVKNETEAGTDVEINNIKEIEDAYSQLMTKFQGIDNIAKEFGSSTVQTLNQKLKETESALYNALLNNESQATIDKLRNRAESLRSEISALGESTSLIEPLPILISEENLESLNSYVAANNDLGAAMDLVQEKQQRAIELQNEQIEKDKERQEQLHTENQLMAFSTNLAANFTNTVFDALENGKNVFLSLIDSIKRFMIELAKAIAQAAIFAAIMSIFTGGSFTEFFKIGMKLPMFASGGLVTGPTMAVVGEGIGTSRTNPEVIAPLDKLQGMLAMNQGTGYIASTRLQGSDILLAIERAERNRTR